MQSSGSAQSFGLYQLENLHRQQAKFIMIALCTNSEDVPAHPLLKFEITSEPDSASAKIQQKAMESQYPLWWPVVLVSKDGSIDEQVAAQLSAKGFINLFSYRGGWTSLIAEAR